MTRRQLWVEVRARLAVVGIAGLVLAAGWLAAGSSVHLGAPAPYEDSDSYFGQVLTWHSGQPELMGWVASHSDVDCPSVVAWTTVNGRPSFIGVGAVPARARHVLWMGSLQDVDRQPVSIASRPTLSFYCYR